MLGSPIISTHLLNSFSVFQIAVKNPSFWSNSLPLDRVLYGPDQHFHATAPLSSQKRQWLTSATSTIFLAKKISGMLENELGAGGTGNKHTNHCAMLTACPPPHHHHHRDFLTRHRRVINADRRPGHHFRLFVLALVRRRHDALLRRVGWRVVVVVVVVIVVVVLGVDVVNFRVENLKGCRMIRIRLLTTTYGGHTTGKSKASGGMAYLTCTWFIKVVSIVHFCELWVT